MLSMTVINLAPVTSRNQSYYGKAKRIEFKGVKYLKSYDTIVCAITAEGEFIRLWDKYSPTTGNHINDFRAFYGFETISKKEWGKIEVTKNFPIPDEVQGVEMKFKSTYYTNEVYNPYI